MLKFILGFRVLGLVFSKEVIIRDKEIIFVFVVEGMMLYGVFFIKVFF